ncbi:hypothetical protein TNCV_4422221 [Trichonephila clavipes]|nr:hypothetical protein TNCV_4422221 [Trichonephila clavipes]
MWKPQTHVLALVLLIVRMDRSIAARISGIVLKRMPRSGSFILELSQSHNDLDMGVWWMVKHFPAPSIEQIRHSLRCMRQSIDMQNDRDVLQKVSAVFSPQIWCSTNER